MRVSFKSCFQVRMAAGIMGALALASTALAAGSVTLTTYYPAPAGIYDLLSANNVGIGTTAPTKKFHIVDDTNSPIFVEEYGNAGNWVRLRSALNTIAAPQAVTAGTSLGGLSIGGYDGAAFSVMSAGLEAIATENFTNTTIGSALLFWTTPNGSVAKAERLRIDGNGNVGIGVASPSQKLVVGTDIGNQTAVNAVVIGDAAAPALYWGQDTNNWAVSSFDANGLNFNTKMAATAYNANLVLNKGSVGIGLVSPATKLDVRGWLRVEGTGLGDRSDSGGVDFFNYEASALNIQAQIRGLRGVGDAKAGQLGFFTAAPATGVLNEQMTIDESGNVGIGITAPGRPLEVVGGNAGMYTAVFHNTTGYGVKIGGTAVANTWGIVQGFKNGVGAMDLAINPEGGKVGVGGVTVPTATLDVSGDVQASGQVTIGGGTPIKKYLSTAINTWNPGNIANGNSVSTNVGLNGANQGDPCAVGIASNTAGLMLTCNVTSVNNVNVTLLNRNGGVVNVDGAVLRVSVFQN